MRKKLTAMVLSMAMAASLLTGCSGNIGHEQTTEPTTKPTEATSATDATKPTETTAATEATSGSANTTAADYSFGFDDNGFLTGVTALDCVEVIDFKDIVIKEKDLTATDEQIKGLQDELLNRFKDKNYSGTVKDGDTVQISYTGYTGGEAFGGGSTGDAGTEVTIGVTTYIDDFLEQLIGHKVGEDLEINVTFPDDYGSKDLAGKDATFYTHIMYILTVPEYNEEFVKNNRDGIREYLSDDSIKTKADLDKYMEKFFREFNLGNKVSEELGVYLKEMDIPQAAKDVARKQIELNIKSQYGVTIEQYINIFGELGYDEEYLNQQVESQAAYYVFYQAVAEKLKWEITDDDLKETFEKGDYTLQDYIDFYGRGYLAEYVIYSKSYDYVMANVTIEK